MPDAKAGARGFWNMFWNNFIRNNPRKPTRTQTVWVLVDYSACISPVTAMTYEGSAERWRNFFLRRNLWLAL